MKDKLKALRPKMRFAEFLDSPAWEEKPLGEQAQFYKGRSISKADVDQNGSRLCIRYGELYTRYGEVIGEVFSRTNVPDASLFLSRKGDVIIPASGETKEDIATASCVMLDGVALGSDLNVIRTAHDGVFLSYLINGTKRREIAKVAQGHTVVHLYPNQLERVLIAFPEPAEQRKIAACLMSLDAWIAAERRKLEALRIHKKGLMQQLFPREGETRPRLRFSEFRNAPEWKATVGGKLFANRNEDGEEGLPIYSVTVNDGMVPRASFDRDFYDIEDPSGNKKVCKGDIAYNMMRMWQGAQGIAVENCMVSPAYVVLEPLQDVCSEFFTYFFKLPQSLRVLTSHSRGLTKDRLRLYFEDFRRVPLRVPRIAEQQRIAACLSSIDTLIAAQSRKLGGLRTHKKGLTQQLFPAMDEIPG